MTYSKEIDVGKRSIGAEFLSINTLYKSDRFKSAGLYYKDIDIIYIERKKEDLFSTIIKTKKGNKLIFKFLNGPENINFHKKIIDNFKYYLKENSIEPYHFHSILTDIDNIEIVETKRKIRKRKFLKGNDYGYESWEYELIVIKTIYGNKATSEMFHYEDSLAKGLAIGRFADREYYRKKREEKNNQSQT